MSDKLALVFGGSRGIGAASVKTLARDGFDVAMTYISNPRAELPQVGTARIKAYQADIREASDVARVFTQASSDFGAQPDCVFANAGTNVPPAPVGQLTTDDFRNLVEVNFVGTYNIFHQAARNVKDGGTIIATTTSLVRFPPPGFGAYIATKGAVECLVRSMSKELGKRGVRVNGVAPGPTNTELFRLGKDEEAIKKFASLSPLNRIGEPQEIAEVVSFLASDKSSWVTGQIVQPNGGLV